MKTPRYTGRRGEAESGVATKILRFPRQPVNNQPFQQCACCGQHFRPHNAERIYCETCRRWHALACALRAFNGGAR